MLRRAHGASVFNSSQLKAAHVLATPPSPAVRMVCRTFIVQCRIGAGTAAHRRAARRAAAGAPAADARAAVPVSQRGCGVRQCALASATGRHAHRAAGRGAASGGAAHLGLGAAGPRRELLRPQALPGAGRSPEPAWHRGAAGRRPGRGRLPARSARGHHRRSGARRGSRRGLAAHAGRDRRRAHRPDRPQRGRTDRADGGEPRSGHRLHRADGRRGRARRRGCAGPGARHQRGRGRHADRG